MSYASMLSNRKICQLSGSFTPCKTSFRVRTKRQFYSLCLKRGEDGALGEEGQSRKKASTQNTNKSSSKGAISKSTSKRRKTKVIQGEETDSISLIEKDGDRQSDVDDTPHPDNQDSNNDNKSTKSNKNGVQQQKAESTSNWNSDGQNSNHQDSDSLNTFRKEFLDKYMESTVTHPKFVEPTSKISQEIIEETRDQGAILGASKPEPDDLETNVKKWKKAKLYLTDEMGKMIQVIPGELNRTYMRTDSKSITVQPWEFLECAEENTYDDIEFLKKSVIESQLKQCFDDFFSKDQVFDCWTKHPQNCLPSNIQPELQESILLCERVLRLFYISSLLSKKDNSIFKKLKYFRKYDKLKINDAQLLMSCTILNSINQGNLTADQQCKLLHQISKNTARLRDTGIFSYSLMLLVDCLLSSIVFSENIYYLSFNQDYEGESGFLHLPLPLKQHISSFLDELQQLYDKRKNLGFYSVEMKQLCRVLEIYYQQANFVQRIFGDDDLRVPTAENYQKWKNLVVKIHGDSGADSIQEKCNKEVDNFVEQYKEYQGFQSRVEQLGPSSDKDESENQREVGFISVGLNPAGDAQIIFGGIQSITGGDNDSDSKDSSKSEEQEGEERLGKIIEFFGQLGLSGTVQNEEDEGIEQNLGGLLGARGKEPPVFDDSSVGMLGLNPKNEDHKDKIEQIKNSMAIMHYAMQQQSGAAKKAALQKRKAQAQRKKPKRLGYIDKQKKKTSISADIYYDSSKHYFVVDEMDVTVSAQQGKQLALLGLCTTLSLYAIWMICASASIGRGDGKVLQENSQSVVLVKIRCLHDIRVPEGEFDVGKFLKGKNVKSVKFEKRWIHMKQYIQQVCGLSSCTEWETATEVFDPTENRWILSEQWMEWCLWKRLK